MTSLQGFLVPRHLPYKDPFHEFDEGSQENHGDDKVHGLC